MFDELLRNITDIGILTTSLQNWFSNLSANSIIIMIMMVFMIIGGIDRIRGNRWGYGQEFEAGFHVMGPTALALVGVVAAAPVLAVLLKPILVPLFRFLGADPAMFATIILANDMGGYSLAMQLAEDPAIGNFSGLIQGSMMGATVVFIIPVALSIIHKKDRPFLGTGVLVGLITIPIGCIAGGLAMNLTSYKLGLFQILRNLVPVLLFAGIICLCLWFFPLKMIQGFNRFGVGLTAVITVLTIIAVFQYETGIWFPLLDLMVDPEKNGGTVPLIEGLLICGQIAIVVIGAFPMVKWVTKTFGKPLEKIGGLLGLNQSASAGLVATLANNIAMFNILDQMNDKGKLLNVAFAVSASWAIGDHLGFTAANNSEMIVPVIIGKVVAGVSALLLANLFAPKLLEKIHGMQNP